MTIYVGSTPTNCSIGGEHGQVTAIVRAPAPSRTPRAAFVHLDTGAMLHVTLGAAVAACSCGRAELGQLVHHDQCDLSTGREPSRCEVVAFREIDRDEFDRLNELDTLRRELGWRP